MVDFASIDKLSPVDVANRTLDGMEIGIMEINVDERASSMRLAMRDDPEECARQMWARTAEFRAMFPRERRG